MNLIWVSFEGFVILAFRAIHLSSPSSDGLEFEQYQANWWWKKNIFANSWCWWWLCEFFSVKAKWMSIAICIEINITFFHRGVKNSPIMVRRNAQSFFSLYFLIIFFDIVYNQKNKVNLPLAVNISVSQLCLLMAINIRMLSKLFGRE